MYSQNQEEKYILEYFGAQSGHLLSIGENDGKTLSNALALIERGWSAVLVEPGEIAFQKLKKLHEGNGKVKLAQTAIGDQNGVFDFYESGVHRPVGNDNSGLLSTMNIYESKRWKSEVFKTSTTPCMDYLTFAKEYGAEFDFISIDAEGNDWIILQQIDLSKTQMVCVEHNQIETGKYFNYCQKFGMKKIYQNHENLIMAK